MLSGKRPAAAERLQCAIAQKRRVRQFAAALAGIDDQRADAAVDVDQRIAARRARMQREPVKLVLALAEMLREFLQEVRALMKREAA